MTAHVVPYVWLTSSENIKIYTILILLYIDIVLRVDIKLSYGICLNVFNIFLL